MKQVGAWTPERFALAEKLFHAGFSCSQIANEIGGGLSRNAVIGKLHRNGLKGGGPKAFRKAPRAPTVRVRKPRTRAAAISPARFVMPPTYAVPSIEPITTRVSLIEVGSDQCHWPAADDGTASMMCGGKVWREGRPYCDYHTLRATKKRDAVE